MLHDLKRVSKCFRNMTNDEKKKKKSYNWCQENVQLCPEGVIRYQMMLGLCQMML